MKVFSYNLFMYQVVGFLHNKTNTLLQQKSVQMGNNHAEQQVDNNNNKEKSKQQTQEQLSSPLCQVLKTYDFGIF